MMFYHLMGFQAKFYDVCGRVFDFDFDVREFVRADAKYNYYIQRQKSDVDKMRKNITTTIPKDIDFKK